MNLLGSELRLRGDKGDAALVDLAGVGVGGDLDGRAQFDATQIFLADIAAQPGVLDVSDLDHGGPAGQDLTHLGRLDQDHAVGGGAHHQVLELGIDQGQLGPGTLGIGSGRLDRLLNPFHVQTLGLGQL